MLIPVGTLIFVELEVDDLMRHRFQRSIEVSDLLRGKSDRVGVRRVVPVTGGVSDN